MFNKLRKKFLKCVSFLAITLFIFTTLVLFTSLDVYAVWTAGNGQVGTNTATAYITNGSVKLAMPSDRKAKKAARQLNEADKQAEQRAQDNGGEEK